MTPDSTGAGGSEGVPARPDRTTEETASMRPRGESLMAHGPGPASGGVMLEKPGDLVGPYQLVSVLGEGGFGTVWLAERREPMVQRVALKIIKPGMDSKSVIARFEQERQALAVMDHPNVARVFDGGVTERGRPYFVMEYVHGEPITAFADRLRMTLRQRLELFVPVCEAVQHAHTKGIIHRDLKPSNILVQEIDGSPVVKVIDFGIAKALTQAEWAQTAFTQEGVVIGTPEYMSPEQVSGLADVDTRSDVYSLGVVLYELLTGELPFDSRELRRAALVEVQRVIREVTPPKPSTRLMQVAGDLTTQIVTGRATTRERLTAELRRELDWIPLMAIRKERERRYASAGALAEDVRRYLDGLPLIAAPDSRVYLARKFVRRNRVQVLAGAAVFLALGVGLAAAIWQANEAARQARRADERAIAAETAEKAEKERADQLKKVSDFQSRMLAQIDTTKAGVDLMADVRERFVAALEKSGVEEGERMARVDALRQELVRVNATDAAAAMIDRTILRPAVETIDREFKDQPLVDARLRQSLADLYESIGLYDAAYPLQESALTTRRRVLGEEHPDTIVSIGNWGNLLEAQGMLTKAEPYYREALVKFHRVLGDEHPDTLRSMTNLGVLLLSLGNLVEAEPYLSEALEKSGRVLGEEHPDTLVSISNIGTLLQAQGKFAEAEPYLREALEKSRRVLGEEHPDTLVSINNMGTVLQAQGKLAEAVPYYREAMEKSLRVLGEEHPGTFNSITNLGNLLRELGKPTEAELYLREAMEKSRRMLGEEHPETLLAIGNMGNVLLTQRKLTEAEPYFREALEKSRRVLGEEHPETLIAISNMGALLQDQGNLDEAKPFYREALEKSRRVLGEEHPDSLRAINNMGILLQAQGHLTEAEPYFREAIEKFRRVLGEEHPDTHNSIGNLGSILLAQGKLGEAEPYLREALEQRRRTLGIEHPYTQASFVTMADLLERQQNFAEAEGLWSQLLALRTQELPPTHWRIANAQSRLGGTLLGQGKFAQAETLLVSGYAGLAASPDTPREPQDRLREAVQRLVDLYTAWHAAEPEKGYDTKASEWRAKLDEAGGGE